MLVVVNQPHINDFKIEGTLSSTFLDNLKKEFGTSMKIIEQDEDEELVNPFELDFFKDFKRRETPGANLRFYRKLVGMTQKELAEKLGMTKQHVLDMERNQRAISKKTAKELARFFDVSVARFI